MLQSIQTYLRLRKDRPQPLNDLQQGPQHTRRARNTLRTCGNNPPPTTWATLRARVGAPQGAIEPRITSAHPQRYATSGSSIGRRLRLRSRHPSTGTARTRAKCLPEQTSAPRTARDGDGDDEGPDSLADSFKAPTLPYSGSLDPFPTNMTHAAILAAERSVPPSVLKTQGESPRGSNSSRSAIGLTATLTATATRPGQPSPQERRDVRAHAQIHGRSLPR